ncbi:hypothetical protein C8Q80DRAFT_312993 [Daedaleopsis nitida]|nr:hypothetical protein C8Q80DRAFT_312993 [Daedaleopsis nitida]
MRLRGARGFIARDDGRVVRPLPGRARVDEVRDWKWMFRISSNWRTGRCSIEQLPVISPAGLFAQTSQLSPTYILLAGNVIISASSRYCHTPTIVLSTQAHAPHALSCPSARSGNPVHITALALDQSPPISGHHGRLACFLSTGEFAAYAIDHQMPSSSSRLFTFIPSGRNSRTAPIVQAVYHHPLLVTLSQSFHLSLYDLSDDTVKHTQTLTSFTSYPPSSLVLSTPSAATYKLILAYAIPVYPSHWTVGATELIIANSPSERMHVTKTRTTGAVDIPQGFVDEHKMRAVREQWGRKVARVADTQTDGKWVVLAPGQALPPVDGPPNMLPSAPDYASPPSSPSSSGSAYASSSLHSTTGLQLYRLHLPASLSSSSAPKLSFVRTLHGQIGPVCALALADGRCVSLGMNGSIWVWDLEAGSGTQVSTGIADGSEDEDDEDRTEAWNSVVRRLAAGVRGTVAFDDRRIVSSSGSEVEVRRFDV